MVRLDLRLLYLRLGGLLILSLSTHLYQERDEVL